MGKDYRQTGQPRDRHWELLSMGAELVFYGRHGGVEADRDLAAFVLGVWAEL
jgi:hypothetical protein